MYLLHRKWSKNVNHPCRFIYPSEINKKGNRKTFFEEHQCQGSKNKVETVEPRFNNLSERLAFVIIEKTIIIFRRTSTEGHTQGGRSASSDSSTGSESSSGSGIRSTGAPFTAEEMKQKYLSKAPATNTTTSTVSSGTVGLASTANRESPTTTTSSPRPFQSRFLGAGNFIFSL